VQFTRSAVEVPVIGLWKDGPNGVFITPTLRHALAVTNGPDLALIEHIAAADFGVPLIAEGRLHIPAQARASLDAGAFAVVVGTAITHPATITGWFAEALK
jgi:putative N-acetylmannosamine-6-phosphate epimerase